MKRLAFPVPAWEALARDFQAIGRDMRRATHETLGEQQERLFDPDKLGNGR